MRAACPPSTLTSYPLSSTPTSSSGWHESLTANLAFTANDHQWKLMAKDSPLRRGLQVGCDRRCRR